MAGDQVPVHRFLGEQGVDVAVGLVGGGAEPLQILPVADARHQLDAQQERQAIHRGALRLGIAVDGVGLDVRPVLDQAVEQVDRLPYPAGDEVGEQRHVGVAHMVVGDAAVSAVADMPLGQQVALVQVPLGAVGGGALGVAPIAGQPEPVVGVDDGIGGGLALVDERHLAGAEVGDVPGDLGRPEAGAIGERGQYLAPVLLLELAPVAAQRPEVVAPADPVERIRQHVQERQFQAVEPAGQRFVQGLESRRKGLSRLAAQFGASADDLEVGVVGIGLVGPGGGFAQQRAEVLDERGGLHRQADLLAVIPAGPFAFRHRDQFVPVVGIGVAPDGAQVAGLEFPDQLRADAHLELAAVEPGGGGVAPGGAGDELPPFVRHPLQIPVRRRRARSNRGICGDGRA